MPPEVRGSIEAILDMKRTELHDLHVQADARMVDFAGWHMPLHYAEGILAEHLATRRHAGLFDISHMGRFEISGPEAVPFLRRVLTNDAAKLAVGDSQYTMLPNDRGGAVDDAYLYRFVGGRYLLVVNAANREKDLDALRRDLRAFPGARLVDISDQTSMISIQGPDSETILNGLLGPPLPPARRNACLQRGCGAESLRVSRTGYAGEPVGFELIVSNAAAASLWSAFVDAGACRVGLGARDTLRLEAALPLYGHELGDAPDGTDIPIFACPLARFAVSLGESRSQMVGYAALVRQAEGVSRRIRPLALTGRGIARNGSAVCHGGRCVGWVTSGTMVPYWLFTADGPAENWDRRALALALIDSDLDSGDEVVIAERKRNITASVVRRFLDTRSGRYAVPVVSRRA